MSPLGLVAALMLGGVDEGREIRADQDGVIVGALVGAVVAGAAGGAWGYVSSSSTALPGVLANETCEAIDLVVSTALGAAVGGVVGALFGATIGRAIETTSDSSRKTTG